MSENKKTEALDFAKSIENCLLATVDGSLPSVRAMEVARLDDDFTVWFTTAASSGKVAQVKENPGTCVYFWRGLEDLRVFGRSEVVADKALKDSIYKDKWDRHYPNGGKDDPEYTVIRVAPEKAEYRNMEKYGMWPEQIL